MGKRKQANTVTELPTSKYGLRLKTIEPKTKNQNRFFEAYDRSDLVFVHGFPGTGKTFLALYRALRDILLLERYDKILVVRSAVPTRDIGHMPGKVDEKVKMYEQPYEFIVNDLTQHEQGYNVLKQRERIEFISTSYIRGLTIENAVIIVDEASNCSFHELDSIITRMGENSKLIFCGDFRQTDLVKQADKNGFISFMQILKSMPGVVFIEMGIEDIVRSDFVKRYILAKCDYESTKGVRS